MKHTQLELIMEGSPSSDDDDFEDAKVRSRAPRTLSSSSKRRRRKSSSSSRRRSGESSSDDENPRHRPAIKHIPQPAQQALNGEQLMAMFKELQRNTQEQMQLQFKEMMKALLPHQQ